jgi:hypothetical protein
MPLQATSGAASYDAFGGGVAAVPNYIEDVFSTWLYTGAGSTNQNIVNGIDLAGKGGLVWIKDRSVSDTHLLFDTLRGVTRNLSTAQTGGQGTLSQSLTSFNSNGFTGRSDIGPTGDLMASWTFREQPKFFDVVTYTGNGAAGRQISHNLGSAPGCIIVKCTSTTTNWGVYHRSLTQSGGYSYGVFLNTTAASNAFNLFADSTQQTNTYFTLGDTSNISVINDSGQTYVAYLFAHDSGGFGLTGTDNVISCGSFTSSSIGLATVDLGYEPQWILYKGSNGATNWQIVDNMRGFVVGAANAGTSFLNANSSAAEGTNPPVGITNTGFNFDGAANITYIYIAIRRGPMKVPTDGTKVFTPIARTGTGSATTITGTASPIDLVIDTQRLRVTAGDTFAWDRLRGANNYLVTNGTSAENAAVGTTTNSLTGFDVMDGFRVGSDSVAAINSNTRTYANWCFKRAPGFFDEVCYTGDSGIMNVSHNLAAVPELMIFKNRSAARRWPVYTQPTGNTQALVLNVSDAVNSTGNNYFNSTSPTSTVFTVDGGFADIGNSGNNYVAYLFATCPGVSKVGSYTGTGATQTINCGFTGGARFVLIKRTDSTGDWYVWDTARGMVSGTDPSLLLNSDVAEVNANSVYTATTGFEIVSTASGINASGGTYIFLAVA